METILSASEWQQLEAIFDACGAMSAKEQTEYLQSQPISEEMRQRLQILLMEPSGTGAVTNAVGSATAQVLEADLPVIGGQLGPYRITGIIGRGGMGIVYKAVRADDAFHKVVAIKAARFSAFSAEQKRRFLDERQILAVLDHPNIARVLDGGTTAQGVPYVVMEYVAGTAIQRYCEEHSLAESGRIALMVQVCRAVGYAHRYLVVHRDLKPENVLVTEEGVPKLLDFGIAKALDPASMGLPVGMATESSQPMTPNFASPEQLAGAPVTTSTDVYQLGVMLYLLLTGEHPFPVPSRSGVAQTRERLPRKIRLPADLDRILQQAMEPEPARRYSSAIELTEDLERYQSGFPVNARSASFAYYARKFMLRHKLATGLAAFTLLLIVGFVVVVTIQARRLARERDIAEGVASFLTTVFSAGNPARARGNPMSARELLDQGAASINGDHALDPAVKSRLLNTLAAAYRSQGIFDRSRSLYAESLAIQKTFYGPRSREVMDTTGALMDVDFDREDYDRGSKEAAEWVSLAQHYYGRNDLRISSVYSVLAIKAFLHAKLNDADTAVRQAVAIEASHHEENTDQGIADQGWLGNILYYEGKFPEEEQVYRRALKTMETPGWQNSPRVIEVMNMETKLGSVLNREGRWQDAATLLRPVLAMRRKIEGETHSETAWTAMELGVSLSHLGHAKEGDAMMLRAMHTEATLVSPTALDYAAYEGKLAEVYLGRGEAAHAESLLLDKATICRKNLGPESLILARTWTDLGLAQIAEGHLRQAADTLKSAISMETKLNGDRSSYAAANDEAMGELFLAQKDFPDAVAELQRAVSLYQANQFSGLPAAVHAAQELSTSRRWTERAHR